MRDEFGNGLVCASGERSGSAVGKVSRGKSIRVTIVLNDAVIYAETSVDAAGDDISITCWRGATDYFRARARSE